MCVCPFARTCFLQKLKQQVAETKAQLLVVTDERDALARQNAVLSDQVLALKRNISCLYKTAKLELDRKNEEIKSLRAQLEKR